MCISPPQSYIKLIESAIRPLYPLLAFYYSIELYADKLPDRHKKVLRLIHYFSYHCPPCCSAFIAPSCRIKPQKKSPGAGISAGSPGIGISLFRTDFFRHISTSSKYTLRKYPSPRSPFSRIGCTGLSDSCIFCLSCGSYPHISCCSPSPF